MNSSIDFEVAVIGGGFYGAALALHAAETLARSTLLVERRARALETGLLRKSGAGPSRLPLPEEPRHPISKGFPLHLYQRVVWGKPNPASALPVPQTILVDDDCKLQTIHTPGHSLDMTSYLEPNRGWLFTGDLYVSKATRYLREDEDLDQQIKSLAFVLRLDFDTVFCAHRGVVESGKQALKDKLDSLLDLSGRAQDLHRQGKSPREITRILLGREDLMTWLAWYHYSKLNVIQWCLKVRPEG